MESTTIYRSNASDILSEKILKTAGNLKDYVFLCIGTSGVVSDSLGPKVGSLLMKDNDFSVFVYGTEEINVNAKNMSVAIDFVKTMHPDKKIVVVDAAVGDSTEVGCVQVVNDGIVPGAATNKVLPRVGDVSLLGIVSMRGAQNFYSAKADRVELVEKMAYVIAESVKKSSNNLFAC